MITIDVDLPKNKPMKLTVFPNGEVAFGNSENHFYVARQIPAGTGDLISRKELKFDLENTAFNDLYDDKLAMEAVDNAPTVVEVV